MPQVPCPARRRAFVLAEAMAIVVIIGVLLILAALLVPDAGRRARLAGSLHNLQQLGAASLSYAADFHSHVPSLSWGPGSYSCDGYNFPIASSYQDGAADQAVCLLRRLTGRTDITSMRTWIPYTWYNQLVLTEYLGGGAPSPVVVSPGDAARLAWHRAGRIANEDPDDRGTAYFRLVARPAGGGNDNKRWSYSTSYEMGPAFFSPDAARNNVTTIAQSANGHRFYDSVASSTPLGNRRFDEVVFPSLKAFMYESNDRFFSPRQAFFMYDDARIPVLHADGGASVRSMKNANPGFHPNLPNSATSTRVNYAPELTWESPTGSGATSELVNGKIRWTRSGLRGPDFQGPEVPWAP